MSIYLLTSQAKQRIIQIKMSKIVLLSVVLYQTLHMTKIGLLSDTHGFLDPKVFKYFDDCDEIWHAGDIGNLEVTDALSAFKPLRAVYGNIDGGKLRQEFPLDLYFEIEGLNVWMTHIAGYPQRYNKRVREKLLVKDCDIFVCGHSHILKVMKDPTFGHLHINPGAAGTHGFHQIRTLIKFDLNNKNIADLKVIELHPRSGKSQPV